MTNKILCIVINWNGWENTLDCITALRLQNNISLDVLVLDNGSDDDSAEKMKQLSAASSTAWTGAISNMAFLYSNTNRGFAGGVNFCLRSTSLATYNYIWLLNNDASPEANCARHLVDFIKKENLSFCSSVIYSKNPNQQIESLGIGKHIPHTGKCHLIKRLPNKNVLSEINKPNYYLSGASLMFNKRVLDDAGYLPEEYFMYCEEKCWQHTAKSLGHRIGVCIDSIVRHEKSGSFKRDRSSYYYYINRANIIFEKKHYGVTSSYSAAFFRALHTTISPLSLNEKKAAFRGIIDGLKGKQGPINKRPSQVERST